jgi:hypothetical protein
MNNENNTINIGVDTVELNQKLDESIKKANRLKQLLEEIVILTSSLGGTVINNFTSNKD